MRPSPSARYIDRNWLFSRYVLDRASSPVIAAEEGVSPATIRNWLRTFGIERRNPTAAHLGQVSWMKGRKHSAEARRKISTNHADVSGHRNPMHGRSGAAAPQWERTDAYREHLSRARKGICRPEMVGAANPAWKGGKVRLVARIRSSSECRAWRLAVFTRDNFTCRDCGSRRGGDLNAHHEERLSALIDRYAVASLQDARECAALWDTSNGTTLCEACHERRHS